MTASNKNSMIGKTIYAGDAKIYNSPNSLFGLRQYYKDDPYYTIIGDSRNRYCVRYRKLSSDITGWFNKSDVLVVQLVGTVPCQYPVSVFDDVTNELRQIKKDIESIAERLNRIAKRLDQRWLT